MFVRCFVLVAASVAGAAAADIRVVEEIVAKVNGDIITRGEIERALETVVAELRQEGLKGVKLEQAFKEREVDALRDQIDQLLLVQKGKDLNINVDPDITRRLAEIQVQSKLADPDKFHEWMREQTGMSFEDFKQQMKNQMLTNKVIGQEITSRMIVPEPEKRKYYEEHKNEFVREEQIFLRQIFISTEGKSPEQVAAAEKKAKEVLARARRGDKFNDLARDNSDDTETSRNGGELPPRKRGMMPKELEDLLFKQRKGFVSDVIKVPAGFVILKVEDRWETGTPTYEEVESEITGRMSEPKLQPKVRDFLTKLRLDAFLEIRAGFVDTGAAPGKDTSWKDPAQLKPETITKAEVAAHKHRHLLWVIPAGAKNTAVVDPSRPPAPAAAAPAALARP